MELTLKALGEAGSAVLGLLTRPFYYIGLLFVFLQLRRQIYLERKLYHVRVHSFWRSFWSALLSGLIAGLAITVPMLFLGSLLKPEALLWLWGVALVLSLFHIRFLCFAYAAGILGIAQGVVQWAGLGETAVSWEPIWLAGAVQSLSDLHMPSLFALVAGAHLAEAVLMVWHGASLGTPVFIEGKRGKLVGAYHFQTFWPVPVFLMVPVQNGLDALWIPWFGGSSGVWDVGWTLLAFPLVTGFTEWTAALLPKEKIRRVSIRLGIYSLVLLFAAAVSEAFAWMILPAALICVAIHELLVWRSKWEETAHAPRFVHDGRGLCVLGVVPGSPAHELGILPGEILRRANGTAVRTKEELHLALRQNPAFVRLEVINLQGESKFLHRALYEGEHHQLGIILAPDEEASYFVAQREPRLLSYLVRRLSGLMRKTDAVDPAGAEAEIAAAAESAAAEPAERGTAGSDSGGEPAEAAGSPETKPDEPASAVERAAALERALEEYAAELKAAVEAKSAGKRAKAGDPSLPELKPAEAEQPGSKQ